MTKPKHAPASAFDFFLKTRVYKFGEFWWCDYVLPYSGRLVSDFDTWEDAYDCALEIERAREWT